MDARLPVNVNVHVNESTIVQTKAHSGGSPFALVALSDKRISSSTVGLFFPNVADLDRLIEAMTQVRHELAALTEHEPQAEIANTTTVVTHAEVA